MLKSVTVTLLEQEHFMKAKINTMKVQQNQEALLNSGVTWTD